MNICVEGPDNSGKTTLVDLLSEVYDREIVHAGKPESDAEAYADFGIELNKEGQLILDRSQAISGMLYDFHVRKEVPYFGMKDCEEVACETLLIVCLPDKELVLADKSRKQMPGVRENHEALYDGYAEMVSYMKSTGNSSVFVYDYTKHKLTDVMNWIEDVLAGPIY